MGKSREYYKRNLPHYQPKDYAFFITFRLYGTLPAEVIENFKAIKRKRLEIISGYDNLKLKNEKYIEFKIEYFELFDDYIDNCATGSQSLKLKEVVNIVKEAMHYRDGKEYDLIAYTIMPNHVHMVFTLVERFDKSLNSRSEPNTVSLYRVTHILQHLKKNTAIKCNRVLNRTGPFWQHESYDHVIRDADELKRIVEYVLNNPVKAGLAETPEEWNYSYVNYDLIPVL
jgi:putative transposase